MTDQGTTITLELPRPPAEVFAAVLDVRGWWSRNVTGATAAEGDEFGYEVPGVHRCRIRLTEVVPGRRVVWRVLDNAFSFTEDQAEWTGTEIRFEISGPGDGPAELRFTHVGLLPEFECYEVCHRSWGFYVGHSLRELVTTGVGRPNEVTDGADVLGPRIDAALLGSPAVT